MANKKSPSEKPKKRYTLQFSLASLLLSGIGVVFILAWVFALGIMVGRGLVPSTMEGFSFFKEKEVKDEPGKKANHVPLIKEEELTFYNQLIDEKSKAGIRPQPQSPSGAQGRATVRIKIGQKKTDKEGKYRVQVAALKDKGKTEEMVERLRKSGYPAYSYETIINGEVYYRVRCGPFINIAQAKRAAARLVVKEGLKPFIVYPDSK